MYNVLHHNFFHQFLGLSVRSTLRHKSLAFHASWQATPVLSLSLCLSACSIPAKWLLAFMTLSCTLDTKPRLTAPAHTSSLRHYNAVNFSPASAKLQEVSN